MLVDDSNTTSASSSRVSSVNTPAALLSGVKSWPAGDRGCVLCRAANIASSSLVATRDVRRHRVLDRLQQLAATIASHTAESEDNTLGLPAGTATYGPTTGTLSD